MKKIILSIFVSILFVSATAFADTTQTSSSVPETPIWKNGEFWRGEYDRSGMDDFWVNTKNFFKKLNPGPFLRDQKERYDTRRTQTEATGK